MLRPQLLAAALAAAVITITGTSPALANCQDPPHEGVTWDGCDVKGRSLPGADLRNGFISLHERENPRKRARLMRLINGLDPQTLTHVVRAFSTYFSLINIVEEAFQHRQRRRRVRAGGALWTGSFDETLRWFKNEGVSAAELQLLLDRLHYQPVFTAHPTEARRRTTMGALRRIFLLDERLDDPAANALPSTGHDGGFALKPHQCATMTWRTDV